MAAPRVPNLFMDMVKSVKTRGWKFTLMQLYTYSDIRFGTLKGVDKFGNKYYEDLNAPFGQHRYVEYADIHNYDPTMIQPEWHGWMHHVFDEPPGSQEPMPFIPTIAGSSVPEHLRTHVGLARPVSEPILSLTQYRHRGYKIGSLHLGPDDEEKCYLNPSHPLSPTADKARFN